MFIPNNYIFQWGVLYSHHFSQYFHKNHNKILCGKLSLVLIWTHHWNYYFYSPILANNNLLLKIYCENIVVLFLNCHFLFFILFFLSIASTLFFFSCFFSTTHVYPSSLLFLFLLDSKSLSPALSLSLSLSLYYFFFYLILEHSLALYVIRNREKTIERYLACSTVASSLSFFSFFFFLLLFLWFD